MRILHNKVSFDSEIIELIKEKLNANMLSYKFISLILFFTRIKLLMHFIRLCESIIAFVLYLPVPIISSIIFSFINRLSGPLGYYLRSLYFRQKARYVGSNVLIGQNVYVSNLSQLSLDDFSFLDKDVNIMCKASVGKRCHIAFGCFVSGGGELVVEDYASLGMKSVVLTSSDSPTKGFRGSGPMAPISERRVISRKNIFRKDSFTGPLTLVFPGAEMKEGSVLAGGSVLRRSTKEWGVYNGNPAKRISWRVKLKT